VEDTLPGIKDVDMVPNLSPQNLASVEIGKNFMLSHGYIKNDFDVNKWAAPEFLERPPASSWKKNGRSALWPSCPKAADPLASGGRIG